MSQFSLVSVAAGESTAHAPAAAPPSFSSLPKDDVGGLLLLLLLLLTLSNFLDRIKNLVLGFDDTLLLLDELVFEDVGRDIAKSNKLWVERTEVELGIHSLVLLGDILLDQVEARQTLPIDVDRRFLILCSE